MSRTKRGGKASGYEYWTARLGNKNGAPPGKTSKAYTNRAEAARVAVIDGDDEDWLWMSQRDIAKNMMLHGRCEELLKAHDAYKENAHA